MNLRGVTAVPSASARSGKKPGEPETRAWTVRDGAKAPEAAGVIHTDFERGFIAADVIGWLDLINQGGWVGARSKGLVRTEGKNYIFKDGDTALFKFNV